MAALATIQDFEARHGALAGDDAVKVAALLDDATGLIRNQAPSLTDEWVGDEANAEPLQAVKAVCMQVAYRAWRNPDAVAREQLGEFAVTYRGDDQSDAIWLTRTEARIVSKAAGQPGMRSVALETPYSGDATADLGDLAE